MQKSVAFTGPRKAELIDNTCDGSPLDPKEIAGRTFATLISPGTELNWGYDTPNEKPSFPGYAAVFEVDAVGAEVTHVKAGDRVFSMGQHGSRQRRWAADASIVPTALSSSEALFARFAAISWSTLTTTTIRPPQRVLVMGLGIVGNMASQLFQAAGYEVTAIEPSESRRKLANACGIMDARPVIPRDDASFSVGLAIDCSGHEQAVIDACQVVRKRGEVVLIGVPWKQRCDATAFQVMHAVFHRYLVLRSGWEWEVPPQPRDFTAGSMIENFRAALGWLATGRLKASGLYRIGSPSDAGRIYDDLFHGRGDGLSVVLDWA